MKNVFTLLCVALLGLASLPSYAQFKLGVTVGVSSNSFGYNYEDSDEEDDERDATQAKLGYTVGLAGEYSFIEALSLQTGVMLSNKGAKYEASNDDVSVKATTSLNYAEIPINLAFKAGNFQVHAGPYVGIGLAGKTKVEIEFGGEKESEEGDIKFKNELNSGDDIDEDANYFRRTDVGLNFGAGYRVGPVLVTGTYSMGLSNLTPTIEGEDNEDKLTNQRILLAATWFF